MADIKSRIVKILKNPKSLIIIAPLGCLLLCGLCSIIILIIGYFSPPELILKVPEINQWEADQPTQKVNIYCSGLKELKLNDSVFSYEDMNRICSSSEEYELTLTDGQNHFIFEGTGLRGQNVSLEITVNFDESAYNSKLAEEEKKKEQEEADEAKQKEDEEKAKQEAEEQAFEDWKSKYNEVKTNEINVSIENSDAMIDAFQNSTDSYQTRNVAKSYKEYFLQGCNNISDNLANAPESVKEDVDNLTSHYNDFCMYNEFLASEVIDYLEAGSISEQYDHLDMISYYQGFVNTAKAGITANISLIDEAIK